MFSTPFRLYFLHCLLALGLLAANIWTSEARAQTAGAVQETTLRAHTVGDQLIRYLEAWANAQSGEAQQQQARQIANAVAQSVRQHPEFLAARAALTSSREGVDEARAAWWPQLSGNTGFGNRTTGGVSINTPTYGVTLSQLLFDFGNTSAKIGAASCGFKVPKQGWTKNKPLWSCAQCLPGMSCTARAS